MKKQIKSLLSALIVVAFLLTLFNNVISAEKQEVAQDTVLETNDAKVFDGNYEEYIAMSGEDQLRFINSFPSTDAFLEWVSAARAEYEASSDKTPIGPDGEVDVSGN
jgi:hypothetical protein